MATYKKKLNPVTGELDYVIDGEFYTEAEIVTLLSGYLLLDQSTHQHVINGAPQFDGGIILKSGQKLVFDGS